MRHVVLLLAFAGCTTNEVRAWEARRVDLERRHAELQELAQHLTAPNARRERVTALRAELDLAGLVRTKELPARVFLEPGRQRLVVSGAPEACLAVLEAVAPARWLLPTWRLRLEAGRCEWEAQTAELYAAVEQALLVSPPRWAPPASQLLSRDLAFERKVVADLEARIAALEKAQGDAATLQVLDGPLSALAPQLATARSAAQPCEAFVIERELALDAAQRGKVLELTHARVIHPLEPMNDFRLRGLVELVEGKPLWRCERRR